MFFRQVSRYRICFFLPLSHVWGGDSFRRLLPVGHQLHKIAVNRVRRGFGRRRASAGLRARLARHDDDRARAPRIRQRVAKNPARPSA